LCRAACLRSSTLAMFCCHSWEVNTACMSTRGAGRPVSRRSEGQTSAAPSKHQL
jgi:hypothetical protein